MDLTNQNEKAVVENSAPADFRSISEELVNLYERKNKDYGNAFGETLYKAGIGYAVGTLLVKANRFASIASNPKSINFEGIEDTLMDIANYAIMTLVEMKWGNPGILSSKGGCSHA